LVDYVAEKNDNLSAPDQYLRSSGERFSTPHTARDPSKIDEIELENKDLHEMIRQSMEVGTVWFHYEPESTVTSHAGVTATTFQGTTSVITARGQYQLEGTRWHLLAKVFSNMASYKADLQSEILIQEVFDNNPKHRSFSWQVLRRAMNIFGAKTYIGETSLTTPHFFLYARRGDKVTWGMLEESHMIVNWSGLDSLEQANIIPTLQSTDNRIILTHPLSPDKTITPPFSAVAQRILYTKGNANR